ncbi:hypothetical protein pb186bvf_005334 [Paramecium bursaria]
MYTSSQEDDLAIGQQVGMTKNQTFQVFKINIQLDRLIRDKIYKILIRSQTKTSIPR